MPPGSGPGSLRGVPRKTIGRNARMRPSAAARFAALVTVTAAVDVLSNAIAMAVPRPRNTGIGRRSRLGMSDTLKALSDNDFRLLFRMERNDFNALLELVRDGLRTNHAMAILAAGQPIPADCRLALALRLLAGASYLDCMLAFGLGRCTVFDVFHQSHLFARDGRNPLRGCVSAIDGLAVRIQRPSVRDAPNPIAYYNRKGFFAVNVQAAVGADFKVQFLSAIATGSCHDSVAFSASGLSTHLAEDGSLPDGYWVAADDAYVAGRRVLTPWPGRNLPWERDSFNYYQSSARIFVEQTFGQLVGRWGILWKPIRFSLPTATRSIRVCAKLHNFLIDRSSAVPPVLRDDTIGGSGEVLFQDRHDSDTRLRHRRRDGEKCPLRVSMTRFLKVNQVRRPA